MISKDYFDCNPHPPITCLYMRAPLSARLATSSSSPISLHNTDVITINVIKYKCYDYCHAIIIISIIIISLTDVNVYTKPST